MSEEQANYVVKEEQRRAETLLTRKLAVMLDADKSQVCVTTIYIDMTGDWKPAAVLDEIMFWTLPKSATGKTSLRVKKDGVLWLAVRRDEWWKRKRLSERQADRAIERLVELDLVEKDVFYFNGKPTVHLRLKAKNFAKLYADKLQERMQEMAEEDDETVEKDLSDLYEMMGFPTNLPNSKLPNGEGKLPNGEGKLPNGEFINSPNTTLTQPNGVPPNYGLDWKIANGQTDITPADDKHARMVDAANAIAITHGADAEKVYGLVMAFQAERGIVFTESQIKGQRKAIKFLLEKKITPDHVRQAVRKLIEIKYSCTDMYAIQKVADELANPAPEASGYNPLGLEIGL